MAREQFLNETSDVKWLKETHLRGISGVPKFRSFIIFGNEDYPDKVQLFTAKNPRYDAPYTEITFE